MSFFAAFFKSLAGISDTKALSENQWRLDGNVITVNINKVPELQRPRGAVFMTGNGLKDSVLVICDNEGGYHSFSNRCTHFGRKLDPVPGKPFIRCCSVSHSTFDYQGRNLNGPAKKPVKVYPTELNNGNLVIII